MEQAKQSATLTLAKFSFALDNFESSVRPVLSAIDALRASGNDDELSPLSRARLHITLCYTVNSLFCMYLRTQGVDPATHPVTEEITRVQEAFMRLRKVEAGISAAHQPMPDRDRRKHIQNVERSAAKLSALVFPEEAELLKALYNVKKRKRTTEESDDDEEDVNKEEGVDEEKPKAFKFTEKGIVEDRDEEIAREKAERKKRKKEAKKQRKEDKRKRREGKKHKKSL